ncbi:hypothetical protein AK812_SmicGene35137 [Symbiodinium microadriaticum]|uniref:Uncharacterized protein n=1 Tax=Symbiodinium microadriaticum TaxID=2951 RepID=A0A1Q9CM92_SYMMI|nr:hypothetical protein AK812_SmicGene35137 [Symbiodinium microadriaticum]
MELVKCFSPLFYGPNEVIMIRQERLIAKDTTWRWVQYKADAFLVCEPVPERPLTAKETRTWRWVQYKADAFLVCEPVPERTLAYCFVMCLHRDDLLEIARSFPEVDAILRRAQIRTAVRRAFLRNAEEKKLEEAGHLPFARTETRGFVRNRDQNVSRQLCSVPLQADRQRGGERPRGAGQKQSGGPKLPQIASNTPIAMKRGEQNPTAMN